MLTIRFLLLSLLAITVCAGCKEEVDLPDQPIENYTKVYMPQAVNGPVEYEFFTGDAVARPIIYGANYGGAGYPDKDITVSFSVDALAVDSFNEANNTSYLMLPAKSFTMESETAVIKKGELATAPLKIEVAITGDNAPDDLSKTYLLPISITNAGEAVNSRIKTLFCLITISPSMFDRSTWTIIDLSSEEANGEGQNNGRVIFALDNNINSFWHSQWQGASPLPPHFFTVDMGESKRINGASFVARQGVNGGRPLDTQIWVSEDNNTWELAFDSQLLNDGATQKRFFDQPVNARYVKLQINSSYSSNSVHLAEFNLF